MRELAKEFGISKSQVNRCVHPEVVEREKQDQRANPEKGRTRTRKYRARHPHRSLVSGRKSNAKWRAEKPEEARAACRKSKNKQRALHPEMVKFDKHRRRNAPGDISRADIAKVMSDPCAYCGGPAEHLEHCTPLSRGGWNVSENCVSACAKCNLSKGNKTVLEFLGLWPKKVTAQVAHLTAA